MVALATLAALASMAVPGGSMPPAGYCAKSDLPDTVSPGGFATSNKASWSLMDVALKAKGLELVVMKNACCVTGGSCPMIVALANGTAETVWLAAQDSRLSLGREAKIGQGAWRPIEFRAPSDCGNSYHKVALLASRAWVWDVPADSGSLAVKCRYVLYGLKQPVVSPEFDAKVDPSVFELPAEWAKGYELLPDGRLAPRKG